jgi:hypothetical protein
MFPHVSIGSTCDNIGIWRDVRQPLHREANDSGARAVDMNGAEHKPAAQFHRLGASSANFLRFAAMPAEHR